MKIWVICFITMFVADNLHDREIVLYNRNANYIIRDLNDEHFLYI